MASFLPLQAQNFSLNGSGCIIGATSITLKSLKTIDGSNITMAMLGFEAFMTLEPGSGTFEEQIVFTGITQNSNGTATLTGVSNVTFETPYTRTSGVLKTHAGSVIAVLSNTSGFYTEFVNTSNDATINGLITFTQPPIGINPGGQPDASTTVKGVTKISVAPVLSTSPISVGDNDPRVPTQGENDALVGDNTDIAVGTGNKFVTQTGLQKGVEVYAATATGNDTYVITLSPIPISYTNGMRLRFKTDVGNTGPATLNVNSLGAIALVTALATPLLTGDIVANQVVEVVYNSTGPVFQVLNPASAVLIPTVIESSAGIQAGPASSSTQTITHGLGKTPKIIRLYFTGNTTTSTNIAPANSIGVWNKSGNTCIYTTGNTNSTNATQGTSTTFAIRIQDLINNVTSQFATGIVGNVGATTFDIVWTNTGGSGQNNINYMWEAQ